MRFGSIDYVKDDATKFDWTWASWSLGFGFSWSRSRLRSVQKGHASRYKQSRSALIQYIARRDFSQLYVDFNNKIPRTSNLFL